MKKFVFGVITYNHEKYIIEHLESIKYLIESYGKNFYFKLVVADDGSNDLSIVLINLWLEQNKYLFKEVKILADGVNRGTCINYTNLWSHIDSPLFKITAGDDVYSYVNLFKIAEDLNHFDYISGVPLLLVDGEILSSWSTIFHTFATKYIFLKKDFKDRLSEISVMNTPNLIYSFRFIRSKAISDFIRKFKVTEDFPMMVKVAEEFQNVKFHQLDEVLVYYRRTTGSTYLVREDDFSLDKLAIFNYLLKNEKTWFKRFLLSNRVWCYKSKNFFLKRCLNLNYFIYSIRVGISFFQILSKIRNTDLNLTFHQNHYRELVYKASLYKL
jgi:hypothetical protein